MSTISLRLPGSLHESVRNLSKQDNISINQFVTTALAEKMSNRKLRINCNRYIDEYLRDLSAKMGLPQNLLQHC